MDYHHFVSITKIHCVELLRGGGEKISVAAVGVLPCVGDLGVCK